MGGLLAIGGFAVGVCYSVAIDQLSCLSVCLSVCVCVCVCVRVHACMYVCAYMYVCAGDWH